MVFLANLGVNLRVCLCGDLQAGSARTLIFLRPWPKILISGWKLDYKGSHSRKQIRQEAVDAAPQRWNMLDNLVCFHPEMVFLANLGVNLYVCLCGDLQVASAQTLDFLDIGQKSSFPDRKLSPTAKSFPDGN